MGSACNVLPKHVNSNIEAMLVSIPVAGRDRERLSGEGRAIMEG